MRAFISIDPPVEVQKYLSELQQQFKGLGKLSFPKSFHLTLKFLGDIPNVDKVIKKLEKIEFKEMELELSEIGVFPKPSFPRVLWIGFKENSNLMKLAEDIEKELGKSDNPFHPHLTLARVKFLTNKAKFGELLTMLKVKKLKFKANELILYKSTLMPEGPVYEKIRSFK